MATKNTTSQKTRVINLLAKGYRLSPAQIATRLKTSTSRARFVVSDLRDLGYDIVTNRSVKKNGSVVNTYSLSSF